MQAHLEDLLLHWVSRQALYRAVWQLRPAAAAAPSLTLSPSAVQMGSLTGLGALRRRRPGCCSSS